MSKQLISFVIPCYRSETTIANVVNEITQTLCMRNGEVNYEIILINDGSPDGTFNEIARLCNDDDHIVGINFSKNFGQHSALMAGLREVRGDIVVCLDDDGQTPADECFKLIDKVNEGYDIVYARYSEKKHNWFRNLGSKFNAWTNHIMFNLPKELYGSSYFACPRFVIDSVLEYTNPYPYVAGLLFRAVKTYANVDVAHRERAEGTSGYTLKKLLSLWANGFTAFSVLPLRIATGLGMGFSVVGFLFAVFTVVKKIIHPQVVDGWSSLMSVVLVIGGLIMMMLGMMGEYVGRIYMCINNKPQYVVRNKLDKRGKNE